MFIPFTVLLALVAYAAAVTLRDATTARRQPVRITARRRNRRGE